MGLVQTWICRAYLILCTEIQFKSAGKNAGKVLQVLYGGVFIYLMDGLIDAAKFDNRAELDNKTRIRRSAIRSVGGDFSGYILNSLHDRLCPFIWLCNKTFCSASQIEIIAVAGSIKPRTYF